MNNKANSSATAASPPPNVLGRILAVDDEPTNNHLLAEILGSEGYEVLLANNGYEAIGVLEQDKPDLILLDIMMPGIDGFEVCRQIKANDATAEIPIIFLTALNDIDTRVRAFEAGGTDFISKPFSDLEIMARVKAQLRLAFITRDARRHAEQLEDMVCERTQLLLHADRLITVGTMSAKMIHEINNPLTTVVGQYTVMRTIWQKLEDLTTRHMSDEGKEKFKSLTDILHDTIEDGLHASKRISQIVEGLRRYVHRPSNFDPSFGRGFSAHFPLASIIESSLRLVQPKARNHLDVHIGIDPKLEIACEKQLIEQVFVNLLKNSADATGESMAKVSISARVEEQQIFLDYKDDGPGVKPELREKIFEPFFTTKGELMGTGLGLMICREILALHGAEIHLLEKETPGVFFQIRFQANPALKPPAASG